jgi:hypothetical protein
MFIIVTMACLMTSCASINRVSVNDPIDQDSVRFIQKGLTTFKDAVEELGAPTQLIGIKDGGAIAVYQFLDFKYSRINYGWLIQFIPQSQGQNVDMVLAGGGFGMDTFEITFDDRWIAQHYSFAKHAKASHYVFWPF